MTNATSDRMTVLGHPPGLFMLFFAEMWERFSYYGMRALLVLYMGKGFLQYTDGKAYAVYGAYTSLVYATPFIGGMLADRLLGQRRAVVFGGLLMAAGHAVMALPSEFCFYSALALLIAGNGFFKPNISTIVGTLYPKASAKKDGGFTIFYMGINLGAALSPILCGYIAAVKGWHAGFGLATIGMLLGVAIFVAPTRLTQSLVIIGAAVTTYYTFFEFLDTGVGWNWQFVSRAILCTVLIASASIACVALGRGGLPPEAGAAPSRARLSEPSHPWLVRNPTIWVGCMVALGAAGCAFISLFGSETVGWEKYALLGGFIVAGFIPWLTAGNAVYVGTAALIPIIMAVIKQGVLAAWILYGFGILAFAWLLYEAFRAHKVERERMFVVLILTFFSILFWAFFEQAGSSLNNFTDRNVDRTAGSRVITEADAGSAITFRISAKPEDEQLEALPFLSQDQLGYLYGGEVFNMTKLSELRASVQDERPGAPQTLVWNVDASHVGMSIAEVETATAEFQAANPLFILIFGLVFSALWTILGRYGAEPSTPFKFAFGIFQLGLGFIAIWYGVTQADERGMVSLSWLLLGYLLHTTGELCLSPVGLSMVTKLAPARIVSTVMGSWFLATAFANKLAGAIAALTGVKETAEGEQVIPAPTETLDLFGDLFKAVGIIAIVSSAVCFALIPVLKKWMHTGIPEEEEVAPVT